MSDEDGSCVPTSDDGHLCFATARSDLRYLIQEASALNDTATDERLAELHDVIEHAMVTVRDRALPCEEKLVGTGDDCAACGHAVDDHVDNGDGPRCAQIVGSISCAPVDECGCDQPITPTEKALHDAYYDGAGMSERSHDNAAQQRGFHSSGELLAWVDARLAATQSSDGQR